MTVLSISEVKRNVCAAIRLAEAEGSIDISKRGKVIAVMRAFGGKSETTQALAAMHPIGDPAR